MFIWKAIEFPTNLHIASIYSLENYYCWATLLETPTSFAQSDVAYSATEASFDVATRTCLDPHLVTDLAHPLAPLKAHVGMALNCGIIDSVGDGWPDDDWRCSVVVSGSELIHQVMDQLELECLQRERPRIRRQGTGACHPDDLRVDDCDVEHPPEHILPPASARPANAIVGPKLVQSVDTTLRQVVLPYTIRCGQLDLLSMSTRLLHVILAIIICRDEKYITLVSPLDEHDAALISPLHWLALTQNGTTQWVGVSSSAQVGFCLQQILRKKHRSEVIISIHMVVGQKEVTHQLHHHAIAEIKQVGIRVDVSASVNCGSGTVARVCVAQTPQLDPPLNNVFLHLYLSYSST